MRSRKLLHVDEDGREGSPPRLEMEPSDSGEQLPPNTEQESYRETEQAMIVYIHPSQPSPDNEQPQPPPQLPPPPENRNQDSEPATELTMYFYVQTTSPEHLQPPPQLPLPQLDNPVPIHVPPPEPVATHAYASAPRRNRRKQTHALRHGKSSVIHPPFRWATEQRAKVQSLKHLRGKHIKTISGYVECKRCQKQYEIEYNLEEKYKEISDFVEMHMYEFRDRAPPEWMTPTLPKCKFCHQENSMKPVILKKQSINWLFLFLGQMLGCCTLAQLKYFCKHTGNHRTGAKDRILFLTYLELFKQVNPERWTL